MSDENRREQIRSVLTDLVNDKTENAEVTMSAILQSTVKSILGGTNTQNTPAAEEIVPVEATKTE